MTLRLGDTLIAGSGANQDLSNLTSHGKNIANWSSNVSNCITEIPQDIKVGLNNGGLYLKAGCKYCVPNGFEQDGVTPHFDFVTVNADTSPTAYGIGRTECMAVWSTDHFEWSTLNNFYSGSTQPTDNWWVWYDTTTNKIKHYNGSTIVDGVSFPICMITENAGTGYDSTVKSIDHVFNGFGYIGPTFFALPGVKGLIPNGRNADGTLKSTPFEISSVITSTLSYGEGEYYLGYIDGGYVGFLREIITHYLKDENLILDDITGIKHNDWMFFGSFYANSSNKITSFAPKTVFHALDYSDSSWVAQQVMPSSRYIDLTLGASSATYTAPANGWVWFDKSTTGAQFITLQNLSAVGIRSSSVYYSRGMYLAVILPVKKGDVFTAEYNAAGTLNAFKFIYAEGEN